MGKKRKRRRERLASTNRGTEKSEGENGRTYEKERLARDKMVEKLDRDLNF